MLKLNSSLLGTVGAGAFDWEALMHILDQAVHSF